MGTVEILGENIRGATALVLVVRVIGVLTDSVTGALTDSVNGALIVDVVVIMLDDVTKGATVVTGARVDGVEITVTVDDSLLVSPEPGIVVASIQLLRLVSKALFAAIIAT